jgi:hypothetical protein
MAVNFAKVPVQIIISPPTQSGNFSTVSLSAQLVTDLSRGPVYSFADSPLRPQFQKYRRNALSGVMGQERKSMGHVQTL